MNANPVLLQKKYARIIENFARKKIFQLRNLWIFFITHLHMN